MRRLLAVAIAFHCARLATAGTLPLSGNDIVLMLRMGYSSEDIVRDLNAKHFVGPLDLNSESQIQQLNASPELLDGLKAGQFDATTEQLTQAQQKIAAANAAAESTEQPRTASQAVKSTRSYATKGGQKRANAVNHPQIIDLEIGQPLDLRQFGGPKMSIIVNGLDAASYMTITLRGNGRRGWDERVKKEDNSLIYKWGRTRLVYIDAMDTALNHVKLGIVSE